MAACIFKDSSGKLWDFPLISNIDKHNFFVLVDPTCKKIQHEPVLWCVNRGLPNLRVNSWQRGKRGWSCTLNGKPAMLCAPVMGGDYLAMQGLDEFSPQISHSLANLPHSLSMFISYITAMNDAVPLIMMSSRLRQEFLLYIIYFLTIMFTVLHFCQLKGNLPLLNIHLIGFLMFAWKIDTTVPIPRLHSSNSVD